MTNVAERIHVGKVFLEGDAAHVIWPIGASHTMSRDRIETDLL
ncbi:MAG: FAD-dependent monooxygenase [Nitrososphaeraceae archaeon]|nr:FAD-dependent monooxygenase [Nitrososphaeraceae archaeon]